MPTVKKTVPRLAKSSSGEAAPTPRPVVSPTLLTLPTEKTTPSESLFEQLTLIYGEPGIGKTSLLSEFPHCLFCMFEPGAKNLEVYKIPIDKPAFASWAEFVRWVDTLVKTTQYQNLVIDTADRAYKRATEHVCNLKGWEHVNDPGYGKGQDYTDAEFMKQIDRLTSSGKGVFFTSHVRSQKFERASGDTYERLMPSLSGRGQELIVSMADVVAYYGYSGKERRLWIGGSDLILAKCRPEGNFFTSEDERIVSIPMGNSHEEAFSNVLTAWNNDQEDAGEVTRQLTPEKRLKKVSFAKK